MSEGKRGRDGKAPTHGRTEGGREGGVQGEGGRDKSKSPEEGKS